MHFEGLADLETLFLTDTRVGNKGLEHLLGGGAGIAGPHRPKSARRPSRRLHGGAANARGRPISDRMRD